MSIKISGSTIIDDSRNIVNAGVVTATSFVGNVTGTATTAINFTGTASTASFATTSFGLSGSPAIFVSSAGINTTSLNGTKLYVQGNAAGNVVGLGTTNATTTLNFAQGNNFSLTLVGSITLANPTGVTTGQSGIIQILQSTGSHTVGYGSHWDFPSATAPTLSTGAGALDCLTYFVISSTSIVTNSLIGIGTL